MGVKGLFQFLRRFEKDVSITEFCKGRSIGIDIFWFIHQSKGDLFALQNMLLGILNNAAAAHCVFDGEAPPEKKIVLEEQTKKRKELLETIERIEEFMRRPFNILRGEERYIIRCYVNELKKQAWWPSPQYIQCVRQWLIGKGCAVYQAKGEADELLVTLELNGTINTIITNDSDLLVLGSKCILRPKSPLRASLFNQDVMCSEMGFTEAQWSDFMYLCSHMKSDDIELAYSFVSVYKDLDYALQKYYILYNDNLVTC